MGESSSRVTRWLDKVFTVDSTVSVSSPTALEVAPLKPLPPSPHPPLPLSSHPLLPFDCQTAPSAASSTPSKPPPSQ
eukprot:9497327-Pyramimonas_sp.AAC.1